jgi:hypothetical protein
VESQAIPHVPADVHVAVPPPPLGSVHGVHDVPHVIGLVLSAQVSPHAWKEPVQLIPHVFIAHVAEPCVGTGQAFPHEPQFVALDVVSTQLPLHELSVAGEQPSVHAPLEQSGVEPEHCNVHVPHVCDEPRSASQPSSGLEEQWAYPAEHADAGTTQTPSSHVTPVPLTCGRAVQS